MKLALSLLKTLPAELAHSLALNGLKLLDKFGLLSFIVKEIKNNEPTCQWHAHRGISRDESMYQQAASTPTQIN